MINAQFAIALVQSLRFAADLRLALRSGSFNPGSNLGFNLGFNLQIPYLDSIDGLDQPANQLFPSGLMRLRLFLQPMRSLKQSEPLWVTLLVALSVALSVTLSLRQCGRKIWRFSAASTPY